MRITIFCLLLLLSSTFLTAQNKKQYRVGAIGFYNFENLFDIEDDPAIRDEEYTPNGSRNWTEELYQTKLDNLAKVVSEMGTDLTPDGMSLLHFDSPDRRGIDVALLYQPKYFKVEQAQAIPVEIFEGNGDRKYTRDVLFVSGKFDQDLIHVFVNHWPSRSGGAAASQAYRNAAAMEVKLVCDSLLLADPKAKIVIMGDLNDDPSSPSVKKVLNAKYKPKALKGPGFFNPMHAYFKKGIGTLAYRDAWNLFDQIIISEGLLNSSESGYQYYKAQIFSPKYLYQKTGNFKGYPFRTFGGNTYLGGYSDHFPVYIFLIKSV